MLGLKPFVAKRKDSTQIEKAKAYDITYQSSGITTQTNPWLCKKPGSAMTAATMHGTRINQRSSIQPSSSSIKQPSHLDQRAYQTSYATKLQNFTSPKEISSPGNGSNKLNSNTSTNLMMQPSNNLRSSSNKIHGMAKIARRKPNNHLTNNGTKTSIGINGVQEWQYETEDPFWPSTRQLT